MNLARSSIKLFIANVTNAAIYFLGILYFARELGATEMGIFFLFQALLGILTVPADFGLRGAVEKRVSEGDMPGEYITSGIILKSIPLGIVVLLILTARIIINDYVGANIASYLALAIILQEAARFAVVVLNGELRVGETAEMKVARQATWVGIGIILVSSGLKAEAIIYSLLAGLGVMLFLGWYKISTPLARPSLAHIRSLFDYGKFNAISSIGGYFYSWMDVAVIGLFLTQAHVGAYEIAWQVTAAAILFSQAISMTIFPQVSEWNREGAKKRIENLLPKVIVPSLILVIPAFFGTVLFSSEILGYIFGQEYTIASLALVLLMADKVFQAIQLVIGKSLQAIDKPNFAARAAVVSLVLNIVLNVILVIEFGLLGAAVATVVSSLVNDILHIKYLRKFIAISVPYRGIAECFIASAIMSGLLIIIKNIYGVRNAYELIIMIIIGAIVYGICALLLPTLRAYLIDAKVQILIMKS